MRFRVEHTFRGITAAEYERLYWNEDFNVELCRTVKLARTVKKREEKDGKIHREVVVGPDREVPKPVAKFLGTDRIEYTELSDYVFGKNQGTWTTIPNIMKEKVNATGTFRFEDVPGGVRRVVEGDIQVKILGVGGVVERFIVSDVEKSYEDAAKFTQVWIDAGKHKA